MSSNPRSKVWKFIFSSEKDVDQWFDKFRPFLNKNSPKNWKNPEI